MDTNSNNRSEKKSWKTLIECAQSSPLPDDLDILPALKRTIEAERYRPTTSLETQRGNWLEEIGTLVDMRWIKPAMAVFIIAVVVMGWQATRDWSELMVAWELQIPGFTSIM